jgi:hypothetical protein
MDTAQKSFAMSHDAMGIGQTIKRLARKATLQNPGEETMLSRQHYKSAAVNIPSVTSE